MFWTILLGLVIASMTYILLMPIELYIDTKTNMYYIQLKGLAKASLESDKKEIIKIKLRVAFFTFYLYPLQWKQSKKKKPDTTKKVKRKAIGWQKIRRVIRTFKVKKMLLDIDTGDNVWNAKLYPLFGLLNFTKGSFNINFEGRNQLMLRVQNRPMAIITSFINF